MKLCILLWLFSFVEVFCSGCKVQHLNNSFQTKVEIPVQSLTWGLTGEKVSHPFSLENRAVQDQLKKHQIWTSPWSVKATDLTPLKEFWGIPCTSVQKPASLVLTGHWCPTTVEEVVNFTQTCITCFIWGVKQWYATSLVFDPLISLSTFSSAEAQLLLWL